MQIGIIGLGLIGGSLAKTLRRIYPQISILACDTNAKALEQALEEGVISHGFDHIDPSFSKCRYLFLCAPVRENLEFVQKLSPYLNESCILTDMGSVKSELHRIMVDLGLSSFFIGGHPMAGSEKSGYENATAYLFENAYYIITHEDIVYVDSQENEYAHSITNRIKESLSQVREFQEFIASLGCIPLVTSPTKHDYMTATVSHLPHILASSLVNLVKNLDDGQGSMKSIAAGGFKDITRIASSSPQMWQEICLSNREQIQVVMDAFLASMEEIQKEIHASQANEIYDFFRQAKDYRDSLPIGKAGPISPIYEVYCDLVDEAGGIATIATLLADRGINIKNIGIIHNREFEEGVLRIEFYEEEALSRATDVLKENRYAVYER